VHVAGGGGSEAAAIRLRRGRMDIRVYGHDHQSVLPPVWCGDAASAVYNFRSSSRHAARRERLPCSRERRCSIPAPASAGAGLTALVASVAIGSAGPRTLAATLATLDSPCCSYFDLRWHVFSTAPSSPSLCSP